MAEGLLHSPHTSKSFEEVGNEIFNDLESRLSKKNGNCFMMHDLLNDLAKSVMGKFSVQLEIDRAQEISTEARYFSCIGKANEILRKFSNATNYVVLSYCMKIPSPNLFETSIEKLPKSMCLLVNLQTLKLRGCHLTGFPSHFYKLINLRHLDLDSCYDIKKMPKNMGKLNRLQTVNHFFSAKKGGSGLKELGALNHLMGSLTISNMETINEPTSLREANLKEKHLDKLILNYRQYDYSLEVVEYQEHVLEGFEPNNTLKEFVIEGYRGTKFPNWPGGSHFLPNLVSLSLSNCTNCVNLPPLGQLSSLEKLEIYRFDGIKVISEEFYGKNGSSNNPFRCLSHLTFHDMMDWKEWKICEEDKSFPCLQELCIWGCPRLTKSLPPHLPCLKKLCILGCDNLETTLPKSSCMEGIWLKGCRKIVVKDVATWREVIRRAGMLCTLPRLACFIHFASWCLHVSDYKLKEISFSDGEFEDGDQSFPEEGLLPSNVESLSFSGCGNSRRLNYRALLRLNSLTSLSF
ncbi:putative disease resistance protein At3g14460 [Prosopis cineraria]|uniref:putative disease resistance protein At3g14460 n=1 Tax=Prosopis cineraria TaxID=364024 RepID=UPI00240F0008|nr:putative disease resistance protein At3g14460 [Prosopis cineraria]